MDTIFQWIGPTVLGFTTLRVAPMKLPEVIAFFQEFLSGWHLVEPVKENRICSWASVAIRGEPYIRIIEPKQGGHHYDPLLQIGLKVQNPAKAAKLIAEAFKAEGKSVNIYQLPNGHQRIEVPWLFGCAIELMPMN